MGAIIETFVDQREQVVFEDPGWCPGHVFVDFMVLVARRPRDWPEVVGDTVIRVRGDSRAEYSERLWVTGAYDSRYAVKVAGDEVFVQVNPSRIDREDNVFGFRFDDALKRVSDLLARHGCTGPVEWRLSRLDLTVNVATGSEQNLRAYLQQLRFLEIGNCEKHLSEYGSVAWHNLAKRLHVYDKASELEAKRKSLVSDDAISWLRSDKQSDEYHRFLVSSLREQGVCRVELKLKKRGLESRDLRDVSNVTQERLDDVFMKEVSVLKKVVLENGTELSDAELGVLVRWMQGDFDKEAYAKNTFYKYRRNIRDATGYDIGAPGPISLSRHRKKVVTRTVCPQDFPGYILPSVEDLA